MITGSGASPPKRLPRLARAGPPTPQQPSSESEPLPDNNAARADIDAMMQLFGYGSDGAELAAASKSGAGARDRPTSTVAGGWACSMCTLTHADNAAECSACGAPNARMYTSGADHANRMQERRNPAGAAPVSSAQPPRDSGSIAFPPQRPTVTAAAGLGPGTVNGGGLASQSRSGREIGKEQGGAWTCSACTLVNAADAGRCAACDAGRSWTGALELAAVGAGPGAMPAVPKAIAIASSESTVVAAIPAAPVRHPAQDTSTPSLVIGDGCSPDEEKRAEALYRAIVASSSAAARPAFSSSASIFNSFSLGSRPVQSARVDGRLHNHWTDPHFLPGPYAIGAGAELSILFMEARQGASGSSNGGSAGGAGGTPAAGRDVSIPIVWKRPTDIADEGGSCAPGSGCSIVSDLDCAQAATRPVSSQREAAGGFNYAPGGAAGAAQHLQYPDEPAQQPSASDIAFLRNQTQLRGNPPVNGHAWVFKRDKFRAEDVVQGSLGSCWFVSALALVAEREWLVQRLFRDGPLQDGIRARGGGGGGIPLSGPGSTAGSTNLPSTVPLNPLGCYQIRLCIHGTWRVITIDDQIPCNGFTAQPAFTSCRRRQTWAMLVEKAAAKACGSYARLAAGTTAEGLRLLTGAAVLSLNMRTSETDEEADDRRKSETDGTTVDVISGADSFNDEESEVEFAAINASLAAAGLETLSRPPRGLANQLQSSPSSITSARRAPLHGPWEHNLSMLPPPHVLDALWIRLSSYHDAGYLMGASCSQPSYPNASSAARAWPSIAAWHAMASQHASAARGLGLILDHAYSILQVYQCPTRGVRLIQLRNPWASGGGDRSADAGSRKSWCGPWCDGSPRWDSAPDLRDTLGPYSQAESGVFWMCLEDLARYFSKIDVGKVRGFQPQTGLYDPDRAWSTVRVSLPFPRAGQDVSLLRITPVASTQVEVVLSHRNRQQQYPLNGGAGADDVRQSTGYMLYPRRKARKKTSPGATRAINANAGSDADDDGDEGVTRVRPQRDLGVLVVEELPHRAPDILIHPALFAATSTGAAGHGNAGVAASAKHALATRVTGMRVVDGCDASRSLRNQLTSEFFLSAPKAALPSSNGAASASVMKCEQQKSCYLSLLSFNGFNSSMAPWADLEPCYYPSDAGAAGGVHVSTSSQALLEINSAQPLLVEVITRPLAWMSKALICRALTIGKAMDWGSKNNGASNAGSGPSRGQQPAESRIVVSHNDGAGTIVVAANLHPIDGYEITTCVSCSTNAVAGVGAGSAQVMKVPCATVTRSALIRIPVPSSAFQVSVDSTSSSGTPRRSDEVYHDSVDVIPPMHAQLIQLSSWLPEPSRLRAGMPYVASGGQQGRGSWSWS